MKSNNKIWRTPLAVRALIGALALGLALTTGFAACDNSGDSGGGGGGGLNPVVSGEFSSAVGDNKLTIILTGGTFVSNPAKSDFTISTPGTAGFTSLDNAFTPIVDNNEDNVATISFPSGMEVATPGSGQKITVSGRHRRPRQLA